MSRDELSEKALSISLSKLGSSSLKLEQEACMKELVVDREDVFVVLPTCYGLIYQVLPCFFEIETPLEYIRVQQDDGLKRRGVRAVL